MRNLGAQLDLAFLKIAKGDSAALMHRRAVQVRAEFKEAIEWVYADYASTFLKHVNAVYITKKEGEPHRLVVYVDESMFAADLNAQREMVKGWINDKFHENIDVFEIHTSRGRYKETHPYLEEEGKISSTSGVASDGRKVSIRNLSKEEVFHVKHLSETVENESVKKAFEKAMTADMRRDFSDSAEK